MRSSERRTGLWIRGQRGHRDVRGALIRYARWLRCQIEFPVRVSVYLSPKLTIRTMHGDEVSASIFLPWRRTDEPYIRIATGDYSALFRERGRDNALAAYLASLSHEVIHYRQWVETGTFWERGVSTSARRMVERYAKCTTHP